MPTGWEIPQKDSRENQGSHPSRRGWRAALVLTWSLPRDWDGAIRPGFAAALRV